MQYVHVNPSFLSSPSIAGHDFGPSGCPPTWDGWQCWSSGGNPGELMYESCPGYIYFHTSYADNMQLDTCGREWTIFHSNLHSKLYSKLHYAMPPSPAS